MQHQPQPQPHTSLQSQKMLVSIEKNGEPIQNRTEQMVKLVGTQLQITDHHQSSVKVVSLPGAYCSQKRGSKPGCFMILTKDLAFSCSLLGYQAAQISAAPLSLQMQLTAFYMVHNPSFLPVSDEMLQKCSANIPELNAKLRSKYGCDLVSDTQYKSHFAHLQQQQLNQSSSNAPSQHSVQFLQTIQHACRPTRGSADKMVWACEDPRTAQGGCCDDPECKGKGKSKTTVSATTGWLSKAVGTLKKEFGGHGGTAASYSCSACAGHFCQGCMSSKQLAMPWLAYQNPQPVCQECEDRIKELSAVTNACFDNVVGQHALQQGVRSVYEFGEIVGNGGFSTVHKAWLKGQHYSHQTQIYAVKKISKTKMHVKHVKALRDEISILKNLNASHPHIYKLHAAHDEGTACYLVTEYMQGGTILEWMLHPRPVAPSESDVCRLAYQACSALSHCHQRGIVHRDIKPENLLMSSTAHDAQLKIGDWGLATTMGNGPVKQFCGTWEYMAPEILAHQSYDQKLDVWAMGIVLHFLLSGEHLFPVPNDISRNPAKFTANVRNGPSGQNWATGRWAHVSDKCTDLVTRLLAPTAATRPQMGQVMDHEWFVAVVGTQALPPQVLEKLSRWLSNSI